MNKELIITEVVKLLRSTLNDNMSSRKADRIVKVCANLLELLNEL